MKALRLQVLHTCVVSRGHTPFDGSPSLSVNTTRNSGSKRPRRLVCFASTVNNWWRVLQLQAKGRSGSDTSKLSCCTRRSYIFRVFFRYICLLHTSINYTENVRIFTRMRKQWIPGALLRFFKRLGTRLLLAVPVFMPGPLMPILANRLAILQCRIMSSNVMIYDSTFNELLVLHN